MKIAFGSDHAGFEGRREAIRVAQELGYEVIDLGCQDTTSVDYPDYAHQVASRVQTGEAELGVLVCGTGQGMAMAANRHRGVRAAVITDQITAEYARAHNDANVACFGERVIGVEAIGELLRLFLSTSFAGDRHRRRVDKIEL